MFDLQALAFMTDTTRVSAFKMSRVRLASRLILKAETRVVSVMKARCCRSNISFTWSS